MREGYILNMGMFMIYYRWVNYVKRYRYLKVPGITRYLSINLNTSSGITIVTKKNSTQFKETRVIDE